MLTKKAPRWRLAQHSTQHGFWLSVREQLVWIDTEGSLKLQTNTQPKVELGEATRGGEEPSPDLPFQAIYAKT